MAWSDINGCSSTAMFGGGSASIGGSSSSISIIKRWCRLHLCPEVYFSSQPKHMPFALLSSISLLVKILIPRGLVVRQGGAFEAPVAGDLVVSSVDEYGAACGLFVGRST